ncbi:metalloregulator ArsR/SmtB family transcription factor [Buttiauxella sp.]|uniref:metalloregulator ArsR/SmtB family transcription factor n=1 Tax=Buttiauxella sp. TaxID=1972222 RepID=UPI003C758E9E
MLLPVQLFKTLSDETRLSIVMLLRESGELCVCDICAATRESQPKVSRHMAILRESGLVSDRREGKWVHYRLSPNMPAWAAATIDNAWNCLREETREKLKVMQKSSCQES